MTGDRRNTWTARSLAAQAMGRIDPATRAIVPPVHVSTTFLRDPDNAYSSGFVYARPDNQTVREAEEILTMLEGAAESLVFSSGMSAATAVFLSLAPGDHVLAPRVMYWSLRKWLREDAARWGIETSFVDMTDLAAVQAALRPGRTRIVWIETPANPLWDVVDVTAVAALAHAAGAQVTVDSTCASPALSQPLRLGADIVMHAATKYLNGHSDVVAGSLSCAGPGPLWDRIKGVRRSVGAILGPWEAFLLIRGMRTLYLRVAAASATAMTLATRLSGHPAVSQVLYPGLAGHPGHAIAARQMQGGFGGMMSIRLKAGAEAAIATAARVSLWKRATSLGGVESLIEHRASIEGEGSPCPPDLLRLSAGIEDPEDLFADLDAAMR